MTKPTQPQINQAEVIDIDFASGIARGTIWSHVYSPHSATIDIAPPARNEALGMNIDHGLASWVGLPGEGLGGMESATALAAPISGYRVDLDEHGVESRIVGFPMTVASSRAVQIQWSSGDVPEVASRLVFNPRTDRLAGTVTNPWDVPLEQCMLVFRGWAYVLDRPLGPGETIDLGAEMRFGVDRGISERTLRSLMTRRRISPTEEVPAAWDPADVDVWRILEMMSFYRGISGRTYTTLTHEYHRHVDFSRLAQLNRAILVARLPDGGSRWQVDFGAATAEYDRQWVVVRMVLPVE